MAANGITQSDKKWFILLSSVGPHTYKELNVFDWMVRHLELINNAGAQALQSQAIFIVERFKVNSHNQQDEESVAAYVAALRQLTEFWFVLYMHGGLM